MPQPLIAALPLDLILASGYEIRFTALSPTTGNAITGVRVTDIALQVRPIHVGPGAIDAAGDVMPLLVPVSETV